MKNKNTKVITAGVGLLALFQGGYIYKQSNDTDFIKEQIEIATGERTKILSELEKNKIKSDSVIGKNSELTKKILIDEEKIVDLNAELKAAKLKLAKLQSSYNKLKAESENNLSKNTVALTNNSNLALEKAKRKEALKNAKDSIERKKMEALVARRNEAEKLRIEAVAAKKSADERVRVAKELAEKARAEALAAKKSAEEKSKLVNDSIERKKMEALIARKNEAEKARLEALVAQKREAEKAKLAKALAEKIKLEEINAKKNEAARILVEKQLAEKQRLQALATQKNEVSKVATQNSEVSKAIAKELAEKNRIEALVEKKRNEIAKARQAISDLNRADENAIADRMEGVKETPKKEVLSIDPSRAVVNKKPQVSDILTKIKIAGLNASSYRYVNEDTKEEEETDDSSEVGFLKVNFVIPQNFVVRASDRNYYIQVLDDKNNLIGDNVTETIDGEKVTYCHRTNIKYKNRAVKVSENIYIKDLKEGTYTIKVLDRKDVVSQTKVVLN